MGFVPNGARCYFLNRSQPPVLAAAVVAVCEAHDAASAAGVGNCRDGDGARCFASPAAVALAGAYTRPRFQLNLSLKQKPLSTTLNAP
jgi:hypothetical protein